MDIEGLKKFLAEGDNKERVFMVVMTLTNNTMGGQPASLQNIRETSEVCHEFDVPFWIDGCRTHENAYFIQKYEKGYADVDIRDIMQ
jgi:tryptophanase